MPTKKAKTLTGKTLRRMLIGLLPVLAAGVAIPLAGAADNSKIKAVRLIQRHHYFGDTETVISLNGVRINNLGGMRFKLAAKAPDWRFCIYRDDDKTIFLNSFQWLKQNGIVNNFLVKERDEYYPKKLPIRESNFSGFKIKWIKSGEETCEYLPLANIAPPQAESILYAVYKMPTNGGIPVRLNKPAPTVDWLSGSDKGRHHRDLFSTSKIEATLVDKDYFDTPLNFHPVKSVLEVLTSKAKRDASGALDELFESGRKH